MSRILIVDDEPDMRLAVRNVLKLRGYDVAEAGDGPSALEMVRAERPDLVLLDMRLPGMDGIEVLEGLKHIDESIPVVMITGYGHIQSAVDVMKLGASEYLQKPFENAQLVDTVRKFVQGAAPQKRSYAVPRREPVVAPADNVPPPPAPKPAAVPARKVSAGRRPLFAAAALLLLLAAGAFYLRGKAERDSYYREYPGAAPNISAMFWRGNELFAGDWLSSAVYVYSPGQQGLKLERTYQLDKTHISGLAAAGDTLYVADSWRKVIEARKLAPGLPLLRAYPMPGKVSALFYDGEYLWTCDGDGNVVLRRTDSELTPAASFKLPEKPDQLFRGRDYLWAAVSSSGLIYRHKLDDTLTLDGVYALKDMRAGYPLSAFVWRDGRIWLARDGLAVLTEAGPGELQEQD